MRERFTLQELNHAEQLLKECIPLDDIVERFGKHSYNSWSKTLSLHRHGQRKAQYEAGLRRLAYVEELLRLGTTVQKLTPILGF